jgi:hypothetical protein
MNRNKKFGDLKSGPREIISVPALVEAGTQPRGGTKCIKPSEKISATPSNVLRRPRIFNDTSKSFESSGNFSSPLLNDPTIVQL